MTDNSATTRFDSQEFLATVSEQSGVYLFYDCQGDVLYVGKARNLKKRMQSYFRKTGLTTKTRLMVSKIENAEIQQTRSDSEALLLEHNLIKSKRPRYNISLRDDKSFPYIRLDGGQDFPRFSFYRGPRSKSQKYYGPYPNAGAVREMLGHIYKTFRLRQCNDTFFRNRSRPCLQYQIKRCSAPCVGRITKEDYAEDLHQAKAMLAGQDTRLIEDLAEKMERASAQLDFETAAIFRDRIASLQRIRERQYVSSDAADADVVAIAVESGMTCFGVATVRQGRNLGARYHIQPNSLDLPSSHLLEEFLPQFYLGTAMPPEILLSEKIGNLGSQQQVFSLDNGAKVKIKYQVRTHRARWVESASINTLDHLRRYLNERSQINTQFVALADFLALDDVPERVECFDISHTMGERTVASCVVFDRHGAVKSDYRRFNIDGIEPGDDYAAMKQVLERRYKRVLKNDDKLPDLVILDGGKGQLAVAELVFESLQIYEMVTLIAVSKGPERRAGEEKIHLSGCSTPLFPGSTSPESHLIQRIRDEAHRFAITGHRLRRSKSQTSSPLEQIEGIGKGRRRKLLRYFGGIQEIKRAGIEDLARVPGISPNLAEQIYRRFH